MQVTVAQIAELLEAEFQGDPDCPISNIAPIKEAKKTDITYLVGNQYRKYLETTQAAAVIMPRKYASEFKGNAIFVENPEMAIANVLKNYYVDPLKDKSGIHPSAVIGAQCKIDSTAYIGAHVVIGDECKIGANTIIKPGTVIEQKVEIGSNVIINNNVTICRHVKIGDGCILYSGTVIGSDGFGYAQHKNEWHKIPQIGTVVIGKNVEIGANSTIDCGAITNTIIGDGVKIDNLVQIGHNVQIGDHTIIAGCAAIAGSTKIGKHCMIGGKSAINGHIEICDGAVITGFSGVMTSIEKPGIYSAGIPAKPHLEWGKTVARIAKLSEIDQRIKKLEKVSHECDG